MGIFRTSIAIAPLTNPSETCVLHQVMVDTGSEYNWIPRDVLESLGIAPRRQEHFETADGRVLTRDIGWAILHAAGRATPTIVVPGDGTD